MSCYLDNPTLAESTEGLARWRLLERYVAETTRETERAVAWLVAHGFLRQASAGARRLFVLDESRHADAAAFVAEDKDTGDGGR